MKNNRILLTGGTGFIASHLLPKLCESYEVILLSRKPIESKKNLTVINLTANPADLIEQVKIHKPDICLHLATKFIGVHTSTQIPELIQSNIEFGTWVAEACALAGCKKFINIGTIWQNMGGDGFNPVNLYASTKEAFSNILKFYTQVHGMQVLNLKLSDSYGPKDTRKKVVDLMLNAIKTQSPLKLSKGEQYIDLVHVRDIIRGLLMAIEYIQKSDSPDENFYLTSQNPIPLRHLGEIIEQATKQKLPAEWGAMPYRPREVFTKSDYRPYLPNWKPEISLEQGIFELWNQI